MRAQTHILIDCPTAYNAATVAALGAADEIIIPVELEGFSLHGAGEIAARSPTCARSTRDCASQAR